MALLHLVAQSLAAPTLALPRPVKRLIVLVLDALLCVIATYFAYYLRLGYWVSSSTPTFYDAFHITAVSSLLLAIPIFYFFGLYRAIFRYSGLPALFAISKASLMYGALFFLIFTLIGIESVPRTVGLIQPILLLLLVGFSRALANVWLGGVYLKILKQNNLPRVLIYGAGSAGRQLATAMANSHEMRVMGFLDDDKKLQGNVVLGWKVYSPNAIREVVRRLKIERVLLAIPSANRTRRKEVLAQISMAGVRVQTLPGLMDLASGKIHVSDLRELDVDDLLAREAVEPNPALLQQNNSGKVVLVTGAGGSIGSELCRQILPLKPKTLLLLDHSEADLYKVHQEILAKQELLESDGQAIEVVPLLCSVTNEIGLESIFRKWQPHIVYHAAAYKHVPLVEENPFEGIRNNTFGTLCLATIAKNMQVPYFVLVSTDKAVRSTNVMGVSKRLAELILQSFAQNNPATIFTMVRFGNVLASSGSVIPKFRKQIQDGGPVTVTDYRMTRYFMTIPEAAQLVIQAGAIAKGGDVFLLDMGKPVKIIDLAKNMIELSGLQIRDERNSNGDIEIHEIGMRPGEKLYEELLISGDPQRTDHPRIFKSSERFYPWEELKVNLQELESALVKRDGAQLTGLLLSLVPEYNPQDINDTSLSIIEHEEI